MASNDPSEPAKNVKEPLLDESIDLLARYIVDCQSVGIPSIEAHGALRVAGWSDEYIDAAEKKLRDQKTS